jgi:hypothetical protein
MCTQASSKELPKPHPLPPRTNSRRHEHHSGPTTPDGSPADGARARTRLVKNALTASGRGFAALSSPRTCSSRPMMRMAAARQESWKHCPRRASESQPARVHGNHAAVFATRHTNPDRLCSTTHWSPTAAYIHLIGIIPRETIHLLKERTAVCVREEGGGGEAVAHTHHRPRAGSQAPPGPARGREW